jgi:hypothetical protein
MGTRLDLLGQRFGRLIASQRAPDTFTRDGRAISHWLCVCDCGREKVVRQSELRCHEKTHCGECVESARFFHYADSTA